MELYYYTTTQTMQSILSNGDIFATNIRYLNDSEEYLNGVQEIYRLLQDYNLLKKWKEQRDEAKLNDCDPEDIFNEELLEKNKELLEKKFELYSISFCEKNDLLSQWAIYARESGVSIKLNFEERVYSFSAKKVKLGNDGKICELWKSTPKEVLYFTKESMEGDVYNKTSIKIFDRLFIGEEAQDLMELINITWREVSAFVKRYDFKQEAEYRLLFDPERTAFYPKIEYRVDNKVLKPYIDVFCENGWPIWEIMVGPGFNQDIVFESVKHFLNNATVKIGVTDTAGYIQRVEGYFNGLPEVQLDEYTELDEKLKDKKMLKLDLQTAKINFWDLVHRLVDGIVEAGDIIEDASQYVRKYYFTKSGVIVTRSSIPYIF